MFLEEALDELRILLDYATIEEMIEDIGYQPVGVL